MRRALGLAAIVCVAAASATLVQPLGCAQTSHYALTRALADGTARIDPYHERTCDDSYFRGHYFSNKGPGLAAFVLPLYAGWDASGRVAASWRTAIWVLGLLGSAVPAIALMLLVRRAVDGLEPGLGTVSAVTLGLGTLVFPFSSLLFSHLLAAALAFAGFVVLLEGRSAVRLVLAGVLVGLAAVTEYPVGLVAVALFAYLALGEDGRRRALLFGAGGVLGLVPLFAYNAWAFGNPLHLSYRNPILNPGQSGHDVVAPDAGGIFGLRVPDPEVAAALLFDAKGLLLVSPVLVAAGAGLVVLARRELGREALLIAGLTLLFVAYNAAFYVPFGGDTPGPRYLIPVLPFLALGLGTAYRRFPGPTAVLAAVSAAIMVTAAATEPMLGHNDTSRWRERLLDGDFTHTVVTFFTGGHGWLEAAPLVAAVAAAATAAGAATMLARLSRRTVEAAAATVAAWALAATVTPELVARGPLVLVAPLVAAAGVALVAAVSARDRLWSA